MAYVADPTDATKPTENDFVFGDAELRALKAYIQSLPVVLNNSNMMVRNTALAGRQDTTQEFAPANYIETDAALNIKIKASAGSPLITTYAAGNNNKGALDYGLQNVADISVACLAGAINYIYSSRDVTTGVETFSTHYIRPQYVRDTGIYPVNLLHFDGDLSDAYGGPAWTAGGSAATSTAAFKFGTRSLSLDGATQYIENPKLWQPNQQGRFCKDFQTRLGSTTQTNQCVYSAVNVSGFGIKLVYNNSTATNKFALFVSTNGTSWNVANAVLSTDTYTSTAAFMHTVIEFDGNNYVVYIDGVAAISVASSVKINDVHREMLGAVATSFTAQTNFFLGYIDEYRSSAKGRFLGAFTPPTAAYSIDESWYVFDTINYIMRRKGFNSAVVQIVFHGEAVTNANSVISILTYAIQGKAVVEIGDFVSAVNSLSHNVGAPNKIDSRFVNVIPEHGYNVGDELAVVPNYYDGTNSRSFVIEGDAVDSVRVHRSPSGVGLFTKTSGGSIVAATQANWKWRIYVERSF